MSHFPSLAPPTRDPRRRPGSTSTGTSTAASAGGPPEPRASKLAREAREAARPYRWLPKQQFTEAQVQKVSGRGQRKQWGQPSKYAKCQRCIVPQQLEIKCDSCNHVLPTLRFSEAMRAKANGATRKTGRGVLLGERVFGSSDDEPDDETLEKLHQAEVAPGGGYGDDDED
ncbi:hypothetical protein JCM21900_004868 [Sporobolomyces salmonicolor]